MSKTKVEPNDSIRPVAISVAAVAIMLAALSANGQVTSAGRPLPAYSLAAQSEPATIRNMRQVAWWPYGPCYDIAYEPASGLLLAGAGGTIMLLDVSEPALPARVSELRQEGQQQHMEISDRVAYITTYRRDGVQVVDLSDPTRLQTIAFFPTRGVPQGIEIAGDGPGVYRVVAGDNPGAVARFTLDAGAPLLPQEGDDPVLAAPAGIAHAGERYLPAYVK